jgi:hypothetical protein
MRAACVFVREPFLETRYEGCLRAPTMGCLDVCVLNGKYKCV